MRIDKGERMKLRPKEFVEKRKKLGITWPTEKAIASLAFRNLLQFRGSAYFKIGKLSFIDEEGFERWQEQASEKDEKRIDRQRAL